MAYGPVDALYEDIKLGPRGKYAVIILECEDVGQAEACCTHILGQLEENNTLEVHISDMANLQEEDAFDIMQRAYIENNDLIELLKD